ncbi:unnamed protein product [Sphagnum troendelagicum]|uniref:Uncharacterized protein n=1 Tax=Sphagnum troendelagicum TaxID=128251 RepID=A0ABP0TBP6_9BRYO
MEQYTHQDPQPMNKAKMRNALERNKLEGDRMSILLLLPPPQRRPPQQHVAAAALRQASHTTMMLNPIMRAASTSLSTKADMGVQQQSTSGMEAWLLIVVVVVVAAAAGVGADEGAAAKSTNMSLLYRGHLGCDFSSITYMRQCVQAPMTSCA